MKLGKDGKIRLSETDIKRQIKSYLKLKGIFYWWNLQGLGCYPGLPDLMGILDNGRFFVVEVKTGAGKISGKQLDFCRKCAARKVTFTFVRSFEEFRDWFEKL